MVQWFKSLFISREPSHSIYRNHERYLYLLILLCMTLLAACGKEKVYSDSIQYVNVPIGDNTRIAVRVPKELELVSTDGMSTWTFSNGFSINVSRAKLSEHGNTDSVRSVGDYYVKIFDPEGSKSQIEPLLMQSEVTEVTMEIPETKRISKLPKYTDLDMVINDSHMYMPAEAEPMRLFGLPADALIDGKSYVMSFMRNYTMDKLEPMLWNIVTRNGDLVRFYDDGDILYLESEDTVVACKKFTMTRWCVYITSADKYANYALKGVQTVHN